VTPGAMIAGKACLLCGAALAVALLASSPAKADTTSCSAFSTTGITFSPYDSVSQAAVLGTGTITLTCTGFGVSTMNIAMDGGYNNSCSPHVMFVGSNLASGYYLTYDVFKDSTRTSPWCTGSSRYDFTIDYSSGPTQTRTITMYGRVGAGQNPAYAAYDDTLSIDLKQGGQVFMTIPVPIRGSVQPTCAIMASPLSFGTYQPSVARDATASIAINCTNTAPYQVSLGSGQNASGGSRRMAGPAGEFVAYSLSSNSARTAPWGDGSAIGAKVSGTGIGTSQNLTVYGRIPANQYARPGSYSDSVFVTVEY
jgi:spore coat protein U-like protein